MRSSWSAVLLLVAAACGDHTVAAPTTPAVAFDHVAEQAEDAGVVGGVFTETDDPTNNAVVAYARHSDGTLTYVANYPTGGAGLGGANVVDPLQSQFAVVLTPDHRFLFAVNAASNNIAAFKVRKVGLGLETIGTFASNGNRPVSLAATNRVLYVLNKNSSTVTGFRIDGDRLKAEPGWTRSLSAGTSGGAAIRFDQDEHLLAVTERTSNTIDVFSVHDGKLSRTPISTTSAGNGPFGFDWTPRRQLIASEAASGSVSSYDASRRGTLNAVTSKLSTKQAAPCWLIATHDGRFAYAANAGSGSITGFAVDADGALSILTPSGMTGVLGGGSTPLDLDVSQDSKFLYVLKGGANTVGAFAVNHDGTLINLPDGVGGLPTRSGQMGIAAY